MNLLSELIFIIWYLILFIFGGFFGFEITNWHIIILIFLGVAALREVDGK